jgi:NADPH:quinone reductase-like Zn-dependent oxidoreductase
VRLGGCAASQEDGLFDANARPRRSNRAPRTRRVVKALTTGANMKAARVLRFGPPSVISNDDVPRPEPGAGQLLVRVKAAGVGNWDALIREGKVQLQPLPLILGAELSGVVEGIGAEVSGFKVGDHVYGATNEQFTGAYAEYAVPWAKMIAQKPKRLSFVEAASAPIVAVTAWQMLFDYARATRGQTALIVGAAGNVGAYALQLASQAGIHVIAVAGAADRQHLTILGAERVVDYKTERVEESLTGVDMVLDTVGGETQQQSLRVLKRGGIFVSAVSPVPEPLRERYGVRAAYFYVDVTTARLDKIRELFETGQLVTDVGTVLPLDEASRAHEMLGGAPHKHGKIVLSVA